MQIDDVLRKCVAFVGVETDCGIEMKGTAFFVSVASTQGVDKHFIYLVTVKHNIVQARMKIRKDAEQGVMVRVNTRAGGFDYMRAPFDAWVDHPDPTVDVSLANVPGNLMDRFDFRHIPHIHLLSAEVARKEAVGIGDEIFLIGLFASHYGKQRNVPVLRVGNIACMPEEPVDTKAYGPIEAYVIESRSIGGLSGSPVFVYLRGDRARRADDGTMQRVIGSADKFLLLGLMHGHWDVKMEIGGDITADSVSSDEARINQGMAIVIPSEKIRECLERPDLARGRAAADALTQRLAGETVPRT